MEETRSEKRSAGLNRELIPMSEELKEEMAAACQL